MHEWMNVNWFSTTMHIGLPQKTLGTWLRQHLNIQYDKSID